MRTKRERFYAKKKLLLGVEAFSFGPHKSLGEPDFSATMWVDVWVEISSVWVDEGRVGQRPKSPCRLWASDSQETPRLKECFQLRKVSAKQFRNFLQTLGPKSEGNSGTALH